MPAPDGTAAVTYGVDAGHSGWSSTELSDAPVVRWRHRWAGGQSSTVVSAVSTGDAVYASVGRVLDGNVKRTEVTAFDRDDGAVRWSVQLSSANTEVNPELAVAGERLFVVNSRALVRALDVRTGSVLWERTLPGVTRSGGAPTPAGTDVYVMGGTGFEETVHALDQRTGVVRWTKVKPAGGWDENVTPAVSGDALIVGGRCGTWALRRSDGSQLWQSDGGCATNDAVHGLVAVDGRVYIAGNSSDGSDTDATILDAATGARVGAFRSTKDPVVSGDSIYSHAIHADVGYTIEARDRATAALRWRHELGHGDVTASNIVAADGRVFYVDRPAGQLVGLSSATGDPEVQVEVGHADAGLLGFMNVGNGVVLIPFGSELIVVS